MSGPAKINELGWKNWYLIEVELEVNDLRFPIFFMFRVEAIIEDCVQNNEISNFLSRYKICVLEHF